MIRRVLLRLYRVLLWLRRVLLWLRRVLLWFRRVLVRFRRMLLWLSMRAGARKHGIASGAIWGGLQWINSPPLLLSREDRIQLGYRYRWRWIVVIRALYHFWREHARAYGVVNGVHWIGMCRHCLQHMLQFVHELKYLLLCHGVVVRRVSYDGDHPK